jgi:DNA polymerase III subunit gamma/tau
LTSAAFNALLKTLEEPPDRVVFVLATTDPQRVLPTIISRCQRFDFRRIPLDDMSGHLTHIAQAETIAIAPDAVQLIAQIAQGGLRDAESLLDQLSLMDGEVTIEKVWDLVGAVPERDLMILTQAIFADDARLTIDTTRHLMDRGREPLIVLQNLASFYRDLLIAKTAPDRADLVPVTAPTWVKMCEFAKVVSGKGLLAGQQQLRSAEVQLKHSTQPRLWLEITLLGLMPSAVGVEASGPAPVVNNVRSVVQSVAPTPIAVAPPVSTVAAPIAVTPVTPPPVTPPKPPLEPGEIDLEATWQSILDNLGLASTKGIIAPNCFLMDVNESTVKIGIRGKQMVPIVKAQLEKLSKSCAKTLNLKSVKLSLVVTEPTPKNNSTAAPPNPQANLTKPENELPPPPPPPRPTPPPATKPADRPPAAKTPDDRDTPAEPWSPDHPVTRAAKSLADAFNGAIVDLNEPLETLETDEGIPETIALDETIEAGLSEIDPDQKNDTDDDDSSINVPF